ncbi:MULTISPECIES: hypothetical protein [unclassified Psychrobacter]|uniref:hypothetical protein n=1 Tax=unclassified Psychrobacter TaxID=196806 RepID=UPI0018F7AB51|nr:MULTISPECIES: hypothetical protein [unclassified Psychrobacter]
MNQQPKLVKPNRGVITRTIMPAKQVPLAQKFIAGAIEGIHDFIVALVIVAIFIGIATGCTKYVEHRQQAEKQVDTTTHYQRTPYEEARIAHFRAQNKHANQVLASIRTDNGSVQ